MVGWNLVIWSREVKTAGGGRDRGARWAGRCVTLRIPQLGNYGANVDRATAPTLASITASIATTATNISVKYFFARV